MQWSRVEELILASKVGKGIYELRNLELVCVAWVSDQHKYYCPGGGGHIKRRSMAPVCWVLKLQITISNLVSVKLS